MTKKQRSIKECHGYVMSKKQFMILECISRTGMLTHNQQQFNMSDKVSSILTNVWGKDWKDYRLARGVMALHPRRKPEKLKWVTLSHPHEDPNVAELFHDISLDPTNPDLKYYLVISRLDVNNRSKPIYKPYVEQAIYWLQGLYMYPHSREQLHHQNNDPMEVDALLTTLKTYM